MKKIFVVVVLMAIQVAIYGCADKNLVNEKSKTEISDVSAQKKANEEKKEYLRDQIETSGKDKVRFLIDQMGRSTYRSTAYQMIMDMEESAIPSLKEIAKNKENLPVTRYRALKILRDLGEHEAYKLVEDEIVPIPINYDMARTELQKLYLEMRLAGHDEKQKLNILLDMMKDKNKSRLTRDKLIEFGSLAVPGLKDIIKNKNNAYICRLDSLWSLINIKDKNLINALIEILVSNEETDQMRFLSARALGRFNSKEAIPYLRYIIENWAPKDEENIYDVRKAAKEALEMIE